MGWFKCSCDGASRGNPYDSSISFYITNSSGDLIYAKATCIHDTISLNAEATTMEEGIAYCITNNRVLVIMKIYCLYLKKIIEGERATPWSICGEQD